MKKRSFCIVELERGSASASDRDQQETRLTDNHNFIENFQTAILLALLEKGQLAKWQFDFCVEELARQRVDASKKKQRKTLQRGGAARR